VFSVEKVKHLPAAGPRRTRDIASDAPCRACAIRHATIHCDIDDDEFSKLVAMSTKITLDKSQMLFTEGDPADRLYSILQGNMMVYKSTFDGRRQITGFLFAGDMLGLTSEGRYVRSAEAITETSLYCYPTQKLAKLVRRYPGVERRLAEVARHELVEAQEQMLLLGRKTAKEKVATFLLKLARQSTDRGGDNSEISLPMSRQIIADYLGLTGETTSRILVDLKREGLIFYADAQRVSFTNIEALEATANGLAQ